jgi:hypothetical protein
MYIYIILMFKLDNVKPKRERERVHSTESKPRCTNRDMSKRWFPKVPEDKADKGEEKWKPNLLFPSTLH